MLIHTAICDDESICQGDVRNALQSFKSNCKNAEFAFTAVLYQNGLDLLRTYNDGSRGRYQIIFMDMDFGDQRQDGISICREIRKKDKNVFIVIVSGYDTYMPDGYTIGAFRYLSKPINQKAFDEAMLSILTEMCENDAAISFLNHDKIQHYVKCADIVYIEHHSKICELYLQDGTVLFNRVSLSSVHDLLPKTCFAQIDKGVVVNASYIKYIQDCSVVLTNGKTLPVSRRRLLDVKTFLHQYIRGHM